MIWPRAGIAVSQRPKSIRWFDRFSIGARACSLAPLIFSGARWYLNGDPYPDPDFTSATMVIYFLVMASPVLPPLLLWYFASRHASRIAKWLLTAFVTYEVVAILSSFFYVDDRSIYELMIYALIGSLDLAAMVMLHRPESRQWFKLRGRFGGIDPKTFN